MCKSVFVAATNQNDGKTTISIGLIHAFSKLYKKIGFIKPVGQQSVIVNNERIDKDTFLIEEICHLQDSLKLMSPVAVPRGFTEDYIINRSTQNCILRNQILNAYEELSKNKEFIIIEGTGHAGVGSVFDFNNAKVAKLLNSKAIILSKGGIGKPIDEIYLSKTLFEKEGVEVIGVIMNQVLLEKYDKIKKMAGMSLESLGLKLLGVIPQNEILSAPTIAQIKDNLNAELLNGDYLHANVQRVIIGAMVVHHSASFIKKGSLLITPGDREDLLLSAISSALLSDNEDHIISGIVLTEGMAPQTNIYKLLKKTNIPVILVNEDTYTTAVRIHDLLVKINPQDTQKIECAKELVNKYVDIDYINRNAGSCYLPSADYVL